MKSRNHLFLYERLPSPDKNRGKDASPTTFMSRGFKPLLQVLIVSIGIFVFGLALPGNHKAESEKLKSASRESWNEKRITKHENGNNESKQHLIGEEIISGQAQTQVEETKLYTISLIDPFQPLNELLKSNKYIFDEKIYEEIDKATIPNQFLHSSYLRLPVEREIIAGDVLVFLPKFETNVFNWELVVSNSLGETVRRIAKKGNPPALISWDGRTETGEMMITGEVYNFTFYAYDALGNQTRIAGKPQRVTGILYQEKGEWIITIAGEVIFQRGSALYVEGARERICEVTNLIKERFKKEIIIYVYTENEALSQTRCDILRKELLNRVRLPKEALAVVPRFIPGLQPKYSKIEIHIR